ncbi:MAG: N-acetylmuramoyl-L-alanine amidase [Deltaproteobacteria bacterium]|nr:N-acetylmuramoyl-L-alanine amidase [Deltaproteobacteria bacterium]
MNRFRSMFTIICWCLMAALCWGDAGDAQFQNLQSDYVALLKSDHHRLSREKWERVIDGFEKFFLAFPQHEKGPAALFMAGRATQGLYRISRRNNDARRGADFFDRLEKTFSCHNLADDALVMAAEIHEGILGDREGAIDRYRKVAALHPQGDQVHLARKRLEELGEASPVPPPVPPSVPEAKGLPGLVKVEGIRHSFAENISRVVLDVTGPAIFFYNVLPGNEQEKPGRRLYVDLKDSLPAQGLPLKMEINDPFIQRIRTGRPLPHQTRIVLDLKTMEDFRVFSLENPSRVVIEIAGQKDGWAKVAADQSDNVPAPVAQVEEPPAPPPAAEKSPVAAQQHPPLPSKPDELSSILEKTVAEAPPCPVIPLPVTSGKNGTRRIVVDAGHGGKDPGAIGPGGVLEKDVVLNIAKKLAKRLENEFRCEVILTRDKDVFIPLEERTAMANRLNADLFISIHANASLNRRLRGVETYYLNFSKNEEAASVAARENNTTLEEVGDLELILFDLMAHAKINESSLLADKVQKGMISALKGRYPNIQDNGVRQGPFHVLLGANMPSILVETAFISNRGDESRLVSHKYQEGVVEGILAGVKNFDLTLNRLAKR